MNYAHFAFEATSFYMTKLAATINEELCNFNIHTWHTF